MRQQQQKQKLCLVQDILIALRQQTEHAPVVQNQVIQVGLHQVVAVIHVIQVIPVLTVILAEQRPVVIGQIMHVILHVTKDITGVVIIVN